jgi:tRNA pseudouridine38-40 synthase
MRNYKLLISYDGTKYCGWQVQPNAVTIQETIQNALSKILREKSTLIGSGRTDSGVHAIGQTAHFYTDKEFSLRTLLYALNGILPKDIRILSLTEVDPHFHAQYSAKGKIYHYHLWTQPVVNPIRRQYVHHVQGPFDLSLLKEGAQYFIGKKDFTAFANSATEGSAAKDPVRTITRLDVIEQEGGIRLEFEGDGFLYKMVRNIVGTLLDVAAKKRTLEDINTMFSSKDRRLAGKAAPARGLFLMQVFY